MSGNLMNLVYNLQMQKTIVKLSFQIIAICAKIDNANKMS